MFSTEPKDRYCLEPLFSELKSRFDNVKFIDRGDFGDDVGLFSKDSCPVIIGASLFAIDFANFVRSGRPYISIGIEHGVAPFKQYTIKPQFLEYDCYISPTRLWAERLAKHFPRYADKFAHHAYPRMGDLQARVSRGTRERHPAWKNAPNGQKDLVLFSWGINFEALNDLADREGVVYLVHPAMAHLVARSRLQHASIVVSTPDDAANLIATADRIFGDFSSITLEAACLRPDTFMFVDRALYISGCDLEENFFNRLHSDFGLIPLTQHRLPIDKVLDFGGLSDALKGGAVDTESAVTNWAPAGLLPSEPELQASRTAEIVAQVVQQYYPARLEFAKKAPSLQALEIVTKAYREVLGREPDYPALWTHAKNFVDNTSPLPLKTLNLYNSFAQSPEARRRWGARSFKAPDISVDLLK